jgi:hypothetical protein
MTEAEERQRAITEAALLAGIQRQRDWFTSLFGTEREASKRAIDQARAVSQNGCPCR